MADIKINEVPRKRPGLGLGQWLRDQVQENLCFLVSWFFFFLFLYTNTKETVTTF